MEKIVEMIPENVPKWALDAMNKGQLWATVFNRIEELQKEVLAVERDRSKCLELFDEYYTMNMIGNKQEFTDAHNKARRYLESKRVEQNL